MNFPLQRWVFAWIVLATALFAQPYRYSYVPKYVYFSQVFSLTIVQKENNRSSSFPLFRFGNDGTLQPILASPVRTKNPKETFFTFYFKANTTNIQIPTLHIEDANRSISIGPLHIPLKPLPPPPDTFSGVLATSIKVANKQVSSFDGNDTLLLLTLEAKEANLEDFDPIGVKSLSMEHFERKGVLSRGKFFIVIPPQYTSLPVSYYDTIKERYITFDISTQIKDSSVVTQSELNPKFDAFAKLKFYTLTGLSVFFLLLFLWKKERLFLILFLASSALLATFYIPLKKICIRQGAPLYLLPTPSATVGTYLSEQTQTAVLAVRKNYYKVALKSGIIGWIKTEDTCETNQTESL